MKKLRIPLLLVSFLAVALTLALSSGGNAAETPIKVTAHINRAAPTTSTVSPLLFGTNLQWQQNGDGLLDPQSSPPRVFPAALQAIKASGVTALRFPGGDLANTYRWKTAVGAPARRGEGLDYGGQLQAQRFGTDEFLALCAAAKLAPVMTVNSNAPAQEAADWVTYVNRPRALGASVRADYWEIGNEVFNPNMAGFQSAQDYGRKVVAFAEAMRARDPAVKIGAVLDVSFQDAAWVAKVLPHLVDWNEAVLRTAGQSIDFVAVHFYAPQDKLYSDSSLRQLVLASPLQLSMALTRLEGQMRRLARPGATIALTEFAPAFGDKLVLSSRIATTETALFDALVLFTAVRHPSVAVANNWSLSNNSVFGMITVNGNGEVVRRPSFDVYRMLSPLAGGRAVPLDLAGETANVAGQGTVPPLDKVQWVDAIAVDGADGTPSVALVNRHDSRPAEVRILDDRRLPASYAVESISAPPGSAAWSTRRGAATSDGGSLTIQLPPHSLTVVRPAAAAAGTAGAK
jgi:alpha-N-arabinofuranosidase